MADKKAKSAPTVSFSLDGDNLNHFNAVKKHMMGMLPGTNPSNAEVVRHMGYIAARGVPPITETEEGTEC